jgi:hypothetical protein
MPKTATTPKKKSATGATAAVAARQANMSPTGGGTQVGAKGGAAGTVTPTKPTLKERPAGTARVTSIPPVKLPTGQLGTGVSRTAIENIIGKGPMALASFHQALLNNAAFYKMEGNDFEAARYVKAAAVVAKWSGHT